MFNPWNDELSSIRSQMYINLLLVQHWDKDLFACEKYIKYLLVGLFINFFN